jgi:hypothetical protein
MRWDDLFDDLGAQFETLSAAEEDAVAAEAARHEFGAITMVERLAGAVGAELRIRLVNDRVASGRLTRVGPDWLLLAENPDGELLLALRAVVQVSGLTTRTGAALSAVEKRFDLRKALRGLARDRASVAVSSIGGGDVSGTIDRVGADFLELAAHAAWEPRRQSTVRSVVLLPLGTVAAVRSTPPA